MACTRDGGTRSGVYRTRSVEARRHAGRHCGTRSPSGEGAKSTTMDRSMRRSSAVAPTRPPIVRTPSSHSTSRTGYGTRSFHAGSTGGWTTTHETSRARPLTRTHSLPMESEWVRVSGRARLVSWVVVHPPVLPAWKDRVPYPVLLVECEEGVRTIGGLVGATAEDLRMDLSMVVDFAPSPDGDLVPQWRPA